MGCLLLVFASLVLPLEETGAASCVVVAAGAAAVGAAGA